MTIDSLRRQLGVVPQEPFLFAGSLRYNIAFARPDAEDEQMWEAVSAVGLADVVERMPEGLDTIVHERGQSLSSGERQLIALARAFLAHPRVLVLDEATSNLDLASETKIEAALDVLLEARTAVLIAHRLTTAMKADRIVVVDDGRIIELGSHAQLVARGGRYAADVRDVDQPRRSARRHSPAQEQLLTRRRGRPNELPRPTHHLLIPRTGDPPHRAGVYDLSAQIVRTFLAAGPLGPCSASYSTLAPSASDLKPLPAIDE